MAPILTKNEENSRLFDEFLGEIGGVLWLR